MSSKPDQVIPPTPASQKIKKKDTPSEADQAAPPAPTTSEKDQAIIPPHGASHPKKKFVTPPAGVSSEPNQVTVPIATANPETDQVTPPATASDKPRCIKCFGWWTMVVAGILLMIALTVFKARDPVITVNSITLQQLTVTPESSFSTPLANNMTIVANMSVKNPNVVSVGFDSTTSLYYRGGLVGVAYGHLGTVPARQTFRIAVTVEVMVDQLLRDPNLVGDLRLGTLEMNSSTNMVGRMKVLGIIKKNTDGVMNCNITVFMSKYTPILDHNCRQHARH